MINAEEYKFKMDKIERYFSLGIMAVFFLSFTGNQGVFWTIVLFTITVIVFIYYFIWYRKKNFYVVIKDEDITIYAPLFFKPLEIKKEEILQAKELGNKIEVNYSIKGENKRANIYSFIMQEDDWKKLSASLKQLNT